MENTDLSRQEILARSKDSRIKEIFSKRILPLLGILIFLGIWEINVRVLDIPSYLLPPPTEIVTTMIEEMDSILTPLNRIYRKDAC